MDVDQSLDALIKAAPKATKKPTAASKAKKKVTLKKKVQPKKKVSSVKVSVKSGRGTKMIRKNTGGRGKPIGGRAVGMAIDQVVRNTGGARSRINNIVSPNAKTNEAPTKLIVSNLDFNVTEKDIKVCCVVVIIGWIGGGRERGAISRIKALFNREPIPTRKLSSFKRKNEYERCFASCAKSLLFFVGGAKLSIFSYSPRWRIISTKPVRMVSRNGEREKPRASSLFGIDWDWEWTAKPATKENRRVFLGIEKKSRTNEYRETRRRRTRKSVWKNLLFFAFSSLSVCVYTRARLNVIAHATKVNRGIKKKRGSCGKVNSLSVFLGCVLVVRALGDCSLFLRKNPAKAPPTKKIEICRNTFFRRVTQTHTQTYTQTMTCKQSFSDRVIAVKQLVLSLLLMFLLSCTLLFIWWNTWTRMIFIWVLGIQKREQQQYSARWVISIQRVLIFSLFSLSFYDFVFFRSLFIFSSLAPFVAQSRVCMDLLLIPRFVADECILVLRYMDLYVCTMV